MESYYGNSLNGVKKSYQDQTPKQTGESGFVVYKSLVSMTTLRERGFELVDQNLYSPDLVPSDYHLSNNT